MKKITLLVFIALLSFYSSMAFAFGGSVYRDGDDLIYKNDVICLAMSFANVKKEVTDRAWTPLMSLLAVAISSKRPLTDKESQICFGTAPTVYVWNVAPSSSGKRPVYLSKRLASGKLSKVKTGDYLASGMPCAADENNTYTHGYKGGKRMWRNIRGSVDFIVYCAKK